MRARLAASLLVALLLGPAFAGCFGSSAGEADDAVKPAGRDGNDGGSTSPIVDNAPPPPPSRSSQQRWHFHDQWRGQSTIVLMNETLDAWTEDHAVDRDGGLRFGRLEFTLPHGVLVPPETGILNVTIHVAPRGDLPYTGYAFRYRSANDSAFVSVDDVDEAVHFSLDVTEDMADVPHAGRSAWTFLLEPRAGDFGLAHANASVHVFVTARIGRPILIDPPHGDAWVLGDVRPLVDASRSLAMARIGHAHVLLTGDVPTVDEHVLVAAVGNRSLVTEGALEILARLTWNSTAPTDAAVFNVSYSEDNSPSAGVLDAEDAGDGFATYRLVLHGGMGDSPYAHHSTWRFAVELAEPAAFFEGDVRLRTWVTRLSGAEIPV